MFKIIDDPYSLILNISVLIPVPGWVLHMRKGYRVDAKEEFKLNVFKIYPSRSGTEAIELSYKEILYPVTYGNLLGYIRENFRIFT